MKKMKKEEEKRKLLYKLHRHLAKSWGKSYALLLNGLLNNFNVISDNGLKSKINRRRV
jgi:hypothetical protein